MSICWLIIQTTNSDQQNVLVRFDSAPQETRNNNNFYRIYHTNFKNKNPIFFTIETMWLCYVQECSELSYRIVLIHLNKIVTLDYFIFFSADSVDLLIYRSSWLCIF